MNLLENEVVLLNGTDVSLELRSDASSDAASKVAAIPEVRTWALKLQQAYGENGGVIMDGRDTTFKVLPNAEVKIFLDTSAEVRAQRRVDQNKELGFEINYDFILEEIKVRDHRDRNRETDPLHQTEDAILIDSSNLNLQQVVEEISKVIERKVGK